MEQNPRWSRQPRYQARDDAATGSGDVWINERRFRILRQIGEGGFAFVYLVREHQPPSDAALDRHASHVSGPPLARSISHPSLPL